MNSQIDYSQQFVRADTNHDGTIDEREFRQFLGPRLQDQTTPSPSLTEKDLKAFSVSYSLIYYNSLNDLFSHHQLNKQLNMKLVLMLL